MFHNDKWVNSKWDKKVNNPKYVCMLNRPSKDETKPKMLKGEILVACFYFLPLAVIHACRHEMNKMP
jgi:hypothetical protein